MLQPNCTENTLRFGWGPNMFITFWVDIGAERDCQKSWYHVGRARLLSEDTKSERCWDNCLAKENTTLKAWSTS
jgi:hypothetical protein